MMHLSLPNPWNQLLNPISYYYHEQSSTVVISVVDGVKDIVNTLEVSTMLFNFIRSEHPDCVGFAVIPTRQFEYFTNRHLIIETIKFNHSSYL